MRIDILGMCQSGIGAWNDRENAPCVLLTCDPMSHRESGWLGHTKVVSSSSRMIMKHLGVQSAILSVTAPGACVARSAEG